MDNTSKKLHVHFMPGDGCGWALDEDQRQMRQALKGLVNESSLAKAEIIHTPFWQGLSAIAPEILKKKFVIAHADNPPFFYLKQPDFAWGQQVVNLWIARSQEALEQFRALRLPVEYIPYTIDPKLFFAIDDKNSLRKKFGIPEHAYVIANFHRDSEGGDLNMPKTQKSPEFFLAILKELRKRGHSFHVLLAGPRRHWLRKALAQEGISFTFVGKENVQRDDFGINILKRSQLNELINAADLYLIASRWEGGPQSVMEAAACRCKVLSTPLGVAKDILEPASLFRTVDEAVDCIVKDQETENLSSKTTDAANNGVAPVLASSSMSIYTQPLRAVAPCSSRASATFKTGSSFLESTLQPQWERWNRSHTTATLKEGLCKLYERLPDRLSKSQQKEKASYFRRQQFYHVLRRWVQRLGIKSHLRSVGWQHEIGKDGDLDNILLNVSQALRDLGIKQHPARGRGIEIIGWPSEKLPPAKKGVKRLQWIVPQMEQKHFLREALLVAPSVQDVLNLRIAGCFQPAIVLPWPIASAKTNSKEPLVVAKGDRFAALDIWKAMAAGRPIIYPEELAYYEQVFHAGCSFQSEDQLPRMIQRAREKALEFRLLAKVPTLKGAQQQLKQLLSIL